MREASNDLTSHFGQEVVTLATCWRITRTDNVIMGFTDHIDDITFDSFTYKSSNSFAASSISGSSDLSVDELDIEGVLDSTEITEEDLMAGKYDYARLQVFMVNYEDLAQGKMVLRLGRLGDVSIKRGQFMTEVRGLTQSLSQTLGRIYSPSCDAILGDSRCGVNLAGFTESESVTTASGAQSFTCSALTQAAGYFTGGELEWTSGDNQGLKMEVKEFFNGEVVLALPMPNAISSGDDFDIVAGCDKTAATCKNTFTNFLNFRGFPDVPGTDKILETAGTRSEN